MKLPSTQRVHLSEADGNCHYVVGLICYQFSGLLATRPRAQLRMVCCLDADLRRLVETVSRADLAARQPWSVRDRAALGDSLGGNGVQASEACGLKVSDVVADADHGPVLGVRGKVGASARSRSPPAALESIGAYLAEGSACLAPSRRGVSPPRLRQWKASGQGGAQLAHRALVRPRRVVRPADDQLLWE
jgi:hypothetical protein